MVFLQLRLKSQSIRHGRGDDLKSTDTMAETYGQFPWESRGCETVVDTFVALPAPAGTSVFSQLSLKFI